MNEEKPDITSQLKERILVLDGAMGTMIQQYRFEEEDYRGNRFSDWPCALKGNNDLLSITQEACIERIHHRYYRNQYFFFDYYSHGRLSNARFGRRIEF